MQRARNPRLQKCSAEVYPERGDYQSVPGCHVHDDDAQNRKVIGREGKCASGRPQGEKRVEQPVMTGRFQKTDRTCRTGRRLRIGRGRERPVAKSATAVLKCRPTAKEQQMEGEGAAYLRERGHDRHRKFAGALALERRSRLEDQARKEEKVVKADQSGVRSEEGATPRLIQETVSSGSQGEKLRKARGGAARDPRDRNKKSGFPPLESAVTCEARKYLQTGVPKRFRGKGTRSARERDI